MITFTCGCGKRLQVADEFTGKRVKCPGCGQVVVVPVKVAAGSAHGGFVNQETAALGKPVAPPDLGKGRNVDATVGPAGSAPGQDTGAAGSAPGQDTGAFGLSAPPQAQGTVEFRSLGGYRIVRELGQGGMGAVYEAEDVKLERRIALKIMKPEIAKNPQHRERFLREARTAAKVESDFICAIYQVGEENDIPFIAMPFLKGEPLDAHMKKGMRLAIAEVVRIGKEVSEGLSAAHEAGLIHRDIKPANIWLETQRSGPPRAIILDFGLARMQAEDVQITQSGMILGTPAYMSPEQAQGDKNADGRTDLFSLGSVLYALCTGELPFNGETTMGILMALATKDPPPPHTVATSTPQPLSDLIMRLLAKKPDDRPQTARDVVAELVAIETDLAPPTKGTPAKRIKPPTPSTRGGDKPVAQTQELPPAAARRVRRRKNLYALVALIAVGLLGMLGGVYYIVSDRGTRPEERKATNVTAGWHGWPVDAPPPAVAPFDAAQAKAHQQAWAKHLGVPVEFTNSIGMKFVLIPPGEFMMGSTAAEIEAALKDARESKYWQDLIKSEAPRHKVILTQPIYLGVNVVTQAEYVKVTGQNPSYFAPMGKGKEAGAGMDTTGHPVEQVNWNDAAECCAKMSEQEKLKPFELQPGKTATTVGTGYRLPTEAEWEFACRAGTTTKYWIGDNDEDLLRAGWFKGNSSGRIHAVGELKANPFGLYDLHGNVFQWVQDGWEPNYRVDIQGKPTINPSGPASTGRRVLRGGHMDAPASFCRSSSRDANDPSNRHNLFGFRVALPVDAVKAAQTPPRAAGPFTDADVQRIAALPAAKQVEEVRKELKRLNPGFDGTLTPTVKNDVLTGLSFSTDEVDNVAPVRALKGLTFLRCSGARGKGKLSDLSPLKGMKLTALHLGFSPVRDLMPLEGMPLTVLDLFASDKLSDLSPLKGMPLTDLTVAGCKLSDLTLLKGMPLTKLDIQTTQVEDLSPLRGMPLTWLCLYNLKVRNLEPLMDMKLTHLDLRNTPVQDLKPLKRMPLDSLWLGGCREVRDLEPLKDMKLSFLVLYGCTQVQDLELFKGMPLKQVEIHGSGVTDLTPLQGKELEMIRLTPKNITQGLDILRNMKSLKTIGISLGNDNNWPPAEFWARHDKGEFTK